MMQKLVPILLLVVAVQGAPQGVAPPKDEPPMPYEYNYKAEDAEKDLYFGAQESGNEVGKVDGSYYVWLPDKRLMIVSYTVDGDSGFVPKITFQENASPIGQPPPIGPTKS